MRIKDLFITGAVAGVTMLGALALIAPTEVDASYDEAQAVDVDGVDVSVITKKARRRPTAEITMVNNCDEAVIVSGVLRLYETSLADMRGRMARPPVERWERDLLYVLQAGEKKTVALRSKKRLKKGSMASFAFNSGDQNIYTASFVPKGKKGKPTKRAQRDALASVFSNQNPAEGPRVAALLNVIGTSGDGTLAAAGFEGLGTQQRGASVGRGN